jgi:hypothetical protein
MKSFSIKSIFTSKQTEKSNMSSIPLTFYVVDDQSKEDAKRALSKVKIPNAPSLHALEKVYTVGDSFLKILKGNDIKITKNKNITKEEAYRQNLNIFQHLIEQRDAIVAVIEKMVQPLTKEVAEVKIEQSEHSIRIRELENQLQDTSQKLDDFQRMFTKLYGASPIIPSVQGGKHPWAGQLQQAADKIIERYEKDGHAEIKQYSCLKDASDEFYDQYMFINKPKLTKPQLYENVKKVHASFSGGKRGE